MLYISQLPLVYIFSHQTNYLPKRDDYSRVLRAVNHLSNVPEENKAGFSVPDVKSPDLTFRRTSDVQSSDLAGNFHSLISLLYYRKI